MCIRDRIKSDDELASLALDPGGGRSRLIVELISGFSLSPKWVTFCDRGIDGLFPFREIKVAPDRVPSGAPLGRSRSCLSASRDGGYPTSTTSTYGSPGLASGGGVDYVHRHRYVEPAAVGVPTRELRRQRHRQGDLSGVNVRGGPPGDHRAVQVLQRVLLDV